MSRTFKDKPFKAKDKTRWPYGFLTRWNDCGLHGKLCSNNVRFFKKRRLERKRFLTL